MHGGMMTYLVDMIGSMAIAAKRMSVNTGVSADLSTSFIKGVKIGDEIALVGIVDRLGKRLAFTRVDMFVFPEEANSMSKAELDEKMKKIAFFNGKQEFLVASGRHTKYISEKVPKL